MRWPWTPKAETKGPAATNERIVSLVAPPQRTWEIRKEAVYRLYLDGNPIQTEYGTPMDYASEEEAQHVAANWDLYRAPTFAELRALSDEELQQRLELAQTLRTPEVGD